VAELRATAWCSMSYWVATCPRPWCINTEWHGPGPVTGRVGGLGAEVFHCLRCGLSCPADWPDNRDDIERLLTVRPMPETRNWLPGETLEDLFLENVTHGLVDLDELAKGMPVAVNGRLSEPMRQLVAAGPGPLAIGGQ
jgi:hypothetical protein